MNQKFSETIRGIWSHFNARIVCLLFVPIFSGATVFLLWLIEQGGDLKLFSFRSFSLLGGQKTYLSLCAFIIIVTSLVFLYGARRPYREAVKLEHYFLKSKIEKSLKSKHAFRRLSEKLLEQDLKEKNGQQARPSKTKE